MTALDRVMPVARQVELDHVELAASPDHVWEVVRHAEFGRRAPIARALFAVRTLSWPHTKETEARLHIDDLRSTPEKPGFQTLVEEPHEVVVGAISRPWRFDAPFVHVAGPDEYAAFDKPGFVKLAFALRLLPRVVGGCRLELELRVDTTDPTSWRKFLLHVARLGGGTRYTRHLFLERLGREASAHHPM